MAASSSPLSPLVHIHKMRSTPQTIGLMLVGMSSGAAMLAALKILPDLNQGCIVVIFPDRGEKHLSTKLFDV